MASGSETFEEQFFTCSICTDVFNEPKVLPCQHSFCKDCIKPYIKSAIVNENDKTGFLCPYCRYFVEAENPSSPAETWIEKIPTNFNLVCMIEAFDNKQGSSSVRATKCSYHKKDQDFYCQGHNQNICANCAITTHRGCFVVSIDDVDSDIESLAIFVSRRLTKVNTLLGRINTNINSVKRDKKSLKQETTEKFDKIKQEIDCIRDRFFESVDRKCDDVTKELQVKYEHCKDLQSQIQGLLEQLVALKSRPVEEIVKGNMSVKEMINLFQSEISKIDYSEIHVQLDWADDTKQIVQNLGVLGVMTVNERKQDEHDSSFATYKYEAAEPLQNNVYSFPANNPDLFQDMKDMSCSKMHSSELNLPQETLNLASLLNGGTGEFSASVTDYDSLIDEPGPSTSNLEQELDISSKKMPSDRPPTISRQCCSFSASIENDSKDCLITGVDFLPDDRIVLADRNNKKLKVFSDNHTFLKSLNLEYIPFDIAVIGGVKIAVSFPEKEIIEFYDCELVGKTGSVLTEQTCYGIATGSGRLFVVCRSTFTKRNCIKVYDGHNNLSQTINLEHSSIGNRLVFSPITNNLFYSNRNLLSATEVVCLSEVCHAENQPKISYIKKIPRLGRCVFALLQNGVIAGSQKSNLYWISFDGQIMEEILKPNLEDELCTVAIKNDGCKLIVTLSHNLFNTEDNNDVYVYDVLG